MKTLIVPIIALIAVVIIATNDNNKENHNKYEYHIILTNDSVFVFDRYDKQIGKYKPTNPKEQFDSILLLDNL